jgi:RimJ/RimL family protein N-acetyltransferase
MSDSVIEIRKATTTDAANLANILCDSWRSAYANILSPEELRRNTDESARTQMFEKMLASEFGNHYIAQYNGVPCGECSFGKCRDAGKGIYAEIISIYTVEEYWGKCVGKTLMEYILREIQSQSYEKVLLWVFEANGRARRFYEKCGFVLEGAVKDSGFGIAREVRYKRDL